MKWSLRKSTKERNCHGCNDPIPKGEVYVYVRVGRQTHVGYHQVCGKKIMDEQPPTPHKKNMQWGYKVSRKDRECEKCSGIIDAGDDYLCARVTLWNRETKKNVIAYVGYHVKCGSVLNITEEYTQYKGWIGPQQSRAGEGLICRYFIINNLNQMLWMDTRGLDLATRRKFHTTIKACALGLVKDGEEACVLIPCCVEESDWVVYEADRRVLEPKLDNYTGEQLCALAANIKATCELIACYRED